MKLAWASPFNLQSAIGRVSADVTRALAEAGHQLTLIATEDEPPTALHATPAPVRHWRTVDLDELFQSVDGVFVNIGDHYLYHAGVFGLLGKGPCVGIFHDFYLHNLFLGWLAAHRFGPEVHDREIVGCYGESQRAVAQAAREGRLSLEEFANVLPMTEWMARRCAGAVAHSPFYAPRLESACPGPVGLARLPVTGRGVTALPPRAGREVIALTVGVMNPNKCVDRVIDAIGASESLRSRLRYRLVGPISESEAARLTRLASDLGVVGLEVHGAVDDSTLVEHLAAADIIACLRDPVLEGASASAIEGLLAGRPVLVADAGFYRHIPAEMAVKTPAPVRAEDIRIRLEQLIDDEPGRRALGARARAWAEDQFTVEAYARVLSDVLQAAAAAAPLQRVGRNLGFELAALGLAPEDPSVERIGRVLTEIFPTEFSTPP